MWHWHCIGGGIVGVVEVTTFHNGIGGVPIDERVGVGVVDVTAFHIGVGIGGVGVDVPVDESVGASGGKSYTGIKWIGSTLD